jgi:hypothetical protein
MTGCVYYPKISKSMSNANAKNNQSKLNVHCTDLDKHYTLFFPGE